MKKITFLLFIILFHQVAFAQWKQLNGPLGGDISCLLNNGGVFYAGTGDGIFVSNDRGTTWTKKDSGLINWSCYINAFAAIGSKVFAATDGGVYVSNDQGNSWMASHSSPSIFNTVTSLSFDGKNLYEGTFDSGVFVSYNSGSTWNWLGKNLPINNVLDVFSTGKKIYATSSTNGFYLSSDSGKTWIAGDTPLANSTIFTMQSHNGRLFAGTGSGTYISKDDGNTWKYLGATSPVSNYCFYGSYVYGSGFGFNISADSGDTWIRDPSLVPEANCFITSGDSLFAGTAGGIRWSKDTAATWQISNSGLCNATVYGVAVIGNNIFAAGDSGVFLSSDDGNSWKKTAGNGLPGTQILTLAAKGNKLFAGTVQTGIYVSTNNGDLWTPINNGISGLPTSINTIAFQGNNIYISGTYVNTPEAYISSDDGASWKSISNNLPPQYYFITEFAFVSDTVYATTLFTVYYSIDSGTHWLAINSLPFGNYAGVTINRGTVAVGAGNAIYNSKDGGATWNNFDGTHLFNRSGIAILTTLNDTLYAGDGYGGLYMSTDTSRTWFATAPLNLSVYSFATGNGYIYMGGLGSGVWKHTSYPSILTGTSNKKKGNGFYLYPNPVENVITLNTGNNYQKIISVLNAQGQVVQQQSNNLPVFNINVSSLPPGIYLIKVNDNNGVSDVQKFVKQ